MANSEQAQVALRGVVERELSDLIRIMAKFVRGGMDVSPNSGLVKTWVSQHPDECIRVALAVGAAQGMTAEAMYDAAIAHPEMVPQMVGQAALAAAKESAGR